MTLIHMPTLDGSKEAAVARLEAWETAPRRRRMAEDAKYAGTVGIRRDTLDLLGVES